MLPSMSMEGRAATETIPTVWGCCLEQSLVDCLHPSYAVQCLKADSECHNSRQGPFAEKTWHAVTEVV
jgi:hypothetical protein